MKSLSVSNMEKTNGGAIDWWCVASAGLLLTAAFTGGATAVVAGVLGAAGYISGDC